jgi:hypothetical protein
MSPLLELVLNLEIQMRVAVTKCVLWMLEVILHQEGGFFS